MTIFQSIAALLTVTAVFSYLNHRYLHLPVTIGVMVIAVLFSIGLMGMGQYIPEVEFHAHALIASIDFDQVLLHGMLSFLLFSGALHSNINIHSFSYGC